MKTHLPALLSTALLALSLTAPLPVSAAPAEVLSSMKVDHRGLLEIPGVLRGSNDHHWGAANLIAFGPGWQYSAQDWALADTQKTGDSLEARLKVGGAQVRVAQRWGMKTRADGSKGMEMTWRLFNPEQKPMGLERAYVTFPLATDDWGGCTIEADGKTLELPAEKGASASLGWMTFSSLRIQGKTKQGKPLNFRITGEKLLAEVYDARHEKKTCYELRLALPDVKAGASSAVTFCISASVLPFYFQPGEEWVEYPFTRAVQPGSILDFSTVLPVDAPAGKHGRIVTGKDGHFALEKTGERIRLFGANLCYDANFPETQEDARKIAAELRAMGYNAVRFHHTDVTMMKGGWKDFWTKSTAGEIDPVQLGRIDALFAACKEAGLYITIDLYAMGCVGPVPGIEGTVRGDIKALVPIDDNAFNVWAKQALDWLNHVNPYTGIAWKDDPAISFICPVNEDAIASVWHMARAKYDEAFAVWKKAHADSGRTEEQLRAQFLTETKVASNRKIRAFFDRQGIHTLLSGSNWWDTMAQTFERDSLDVVDNHQYCDHPMPGFHVLPNRNNGRSTLREGNPTYMVPVMKMPTRIFGKPFIITEWNFCVPNQHRAEGGAMMGAYAALQDWDGLYRFAWSHGYEGVREDPFRINGFDISGDPVALYTERLVALLFARGDAAPARERHVYAVAMDEATDPGVGDMWAKGIFPHDFNTLGLLHQIGSHVIGDGRTLPADGGFTAAYAKSAAATPEALAGTPKGTLAKRDTLKQNGAWCSDTGELRLDNKAGTLLVDTPRTAAVVGPAGEAPLTAGALSVRDRTRFASVSASAMDGKSLGESRRILLLHITDVINTDMVFADASRRELHDWGTLPHLLRTGSATVTLRAAPGLTLYKVAPDGARIGKIPATYADGAYTFTVAVKPGEAAPTMVYELAP